MIRYIPAPNRNGGDGEVTFASQMRVYFDGNQVVPFVQIVKLTFNNVQWDNNDEWDAENNRWICKEDGIYHFDACCNFPNFPGSAWLMIIKNDADSLVNVADKDGEGGSVYVRLSSDAKFVAGDYIDVRVLHMKYTSIDLWGGDSCMYFNIHRIK